LTKCNVKLPVIGDKTSLYACKYNVQGTTLTGKVFRKNFRLVQLAIMPCCCQTNST